VAKLADQLRGGSDPRHLPMIEALARRTAWPLLALPYLRQIDSDARRLIRTPREDL
jgi:hypothetical protein